MVGIVCWEEILKAVHMTWSLSTLRFNRAVVMTVITDLVKRRAKGLGVIEKLSCTHYDMNWSKHMVFRMEVKVQP